MSATLPQGMIVRFEAEMQVSGRGRIVGLAGLNKYIIELLEHQGIDPEVYPYTHMIISKYDILELFDLKG